MLIASFGFVMRGAIMDTMQLKLFVSLSRTLNFTRTAGEFFMSQPTVSNQIRSLESELGMPLLERSSHRVSLTEAGAEFVGYAARMLETQAAAELRLRNLADDRPGHVRVAMLSSWAQAFALSLKEFSRRWPRVQVDVAMLEGSEMLRAIRQTDYDLYFANEPMMPQKDSELRYAVAGEGQLHLFVHKSLAPSIDMDNWATIGCHPFVSMQASDFTLSSQIETLCAHRGIKPDIINYYNRADMLLLSVASGVGVAILPPEFAAFRCPDEVAALTIDGEDALLRTVVAWRADSGNADAENFRAVALGERI